MSLRVVIAPDSFKGSLGARQIAEAIAHGWRTVRPHDELVLLPLADGGEGTLDAIEAAVPGARRRSAGVVTGPDGRPTAGEWVLLPDGTAVVELAQCSGLPLMERLDARGATTRGLGEVISAALDAGARRLIIGLGGSASTDGGLGALRALGVAATDARGEPLADGGGELARLGALDLTALRPAPPGGVTVWTDVTAPLTGPFGAAAVFGPQKGAGPADVEALDAGLTTLARLLGGAPDEPGAGAAGGAAYGFAAAWGARIESGADALVDLGGVGEAIDRADLVLTGEGRFDSQSLGGKLVGQLLARAGAHRTGIIAGQVTASTEAWTASLVDLAGSTDAALADPARWVTAAGEAAARALPTR